ncbi:hypothetical protein [uncultured Arthrobacter sp.]|uniref:hypothetical protein n=1 Tax=uncultured Arthrobacter sp. TaxID=114050 RepID=UPI0025E93A3F|nr:hypothetical protein [uncultured Arthrobacter sp.]
MTNAAKPSRALVDGVWADEFARVIAATQRDTAIRAAQYLRAQATLRFGSHGADDSRGAALWDAACALDPDDGNALA